jgi:hypothetical protein
VLPDKTALKQPRGFQKGQSGNPAGRAQGSRTKATLFAEAILENDREGIMGAVVAIMFKPSCGRIAEKSSTTSSTKPTSRKP